VVNAPCPAATASLTIADLLADETEVAFDVGASQAAPQKQ
jgi:hypothetical protein